MAMKIRIPGLIDALVVDDEVEMARLNNEPAVGRALSPAGGLIHRFLWKKLTRDLAVGGAPLPVFVAREDTARAEAQRKLEEELTARAGDAAPFDRAAVIALGQYVAGAETDLPVGVAVQQVIGRLFDDAYHASPQSYRAARVLVALRSACPMTMLRVWWWRLTGRLARSKRIIADLAHDDPAMVHATSIAMHNVVDALARMRATMRRDGPWHDTPAEAAADALVAPSMLLRQCPVKADLPPAVRPGTLVLFRLKAMHAGTASNDLAFGRHAWSQCPAHAIVPRLLADVWTAAVTARAGLRYRPVRRSWPRRSLRRLGAAVAAPLVVLVDGALVLMRGLFVRLNRRRAWYALPRPLPFFNLIVLRDILRERNLHDTSLLPTAGPTTLPPAHRDVLHWRTADGSFNDLDDPSMGRAGTRFGRNVPLDHTWPDRAALLDPDPRLVSRKLLARTNFTPAATLNVLAAAWIQFNVHDWFDHELAPPTDAPFGIEIRPPDPWAGPNPMSIARTRPDPTRSDDPPVGPPTYINNVTHWWDASQLYGSDVATQLRVRSRREGKLALDEHGLLPVGEAGPEARPGPPVEVTGFNKNWWLGLSLFHHLFTYEHNAICDRLRAEYPAWTDERLFQTARLINAALIAKIHEIDWVPIVLANPTVKHGLRVTWWGLLGKWFATRIGRFRSSDLLTGIPGSATDHHAAPYAITEEFVSVYRMHAFMMPQSFSVYPVGGGEAVGPMAVEGILGPASRGVLERFGMATLLNSFGRNVPGALTLRNYSPALQELKLAPTTGPVIDLAAVDLLRDRERGVPRYNQFRQLVHLPPIRTFKELTPDPELASALQEVYGSVDRIDLMVGLFAETPPPGFALSDTTFRIFLLMNGRRLKSDRFYTTDYTAEVYTPAGLDWVDDNDLRSVLLRHHPELTPVIGDARKVPNVFGPWST